MNDGLTALRRLCVTVVRLVAEYDKLSVKDGEALLANLTAPGEQRLGPALSKAIYDAFQA